MVCCLIILSAIVEFFLGSLLGSYTGNTLPPKYQSYHFIVVCRSLSHTLPSPAFLCTTPFPRAGARDVFLPALPLPSDSRSSAGACKLNTTHCPVLKFLCSHSQHHSFVFCLESLKQFPKWNLDQSFWKGFPQVEEAARTKLLGLEESFRGCAKAWKCVICSSNSVSPNVSISDRTSTSMVISYPAVLAWYFAPGLFYWYYKGLLWGRYQIEVILWGNYIWSVHSFIKAEPVFNFSSTQY